MPGLALGRQAVPTAQPSAGELSLASLASASRLRYGAGIALLAALYYGAAQLGYELEFAGPVAAIVWLPVGVGIAYLYLGGLSFWPGVVIGDLLANDYSTLPLGSALGQTLGNTLEVLVATLLLRRLLRNASPLDSIGGLARMLLAIAAGTLVSATVGALSLRLGHVIASHEMPNVWRTWWLGDASGALILVPLAIAWYRPPRLEWLKGRWLEAALVLAAVAGLSELALRTDRPLTYLVFPPLIWAALRFGHRGATLAIAIATGFTVWETTHHVGPFVYQSIDRSVLITQLYIAVAAISTLVLTAVVSERERIAGRLAASRTRLVEAADTERRRLEHNLHDGAQQRLTALVVHLEVAAERARREPDRAAALIEAAETELSLAIDELRELARGIHPAVLTELGLTGAMKSLASRSTVPIQLIQLPATRLDETAEATAYYLFAEAVTNAQKHAHASSIRARASVGHNVVRVEVVDDGLGGAVESAGSGLEGLRDRVEAIGGTFEVDSAPGHGTRIAAVVPATIVAS
jgi:signal transduction histidine kinase